MSKTYSAGIVTAYGAAKRAGYHGTYEDFCRQQAGYAESAATVEQAKTTAVNAASTATAKAGEATTAATAAQTAKTQTEAAASQALTNIGTARTAAISAVQTEGQTQIASARAQAQAAAQSATTASTKASEASASATSARQSATNAAASATNAASSASAAQGVLESIPEEYSDLSEDVDQLKADLDDVNDLLTYTENVDFANAVTISGLVNTSNKWSTTSGFYSYKLPVPDNSYKVSITAAYDKSATISFFTNDTPVSGNEAPFCVGTGRNVIPQNTTSIFNIPDDCAYIVVTKRGTNADYTPVAMSFVFNKIIPEIDETLTLTGKAAGSKVTGNRFVSIENRLYRIEDLFTITEPVDFSEAFSGNGMINGSNVWSLTTGYYSYLFAIESGQYDAVTVTANETLFAVISFLASRTLSWGDAPTWASGYVGRQTIPAGETRTFNIPEDCVYIVVTKNASSNIYEPSSMAFEVRKAPILETAPPLGLHEMPPTLSALNIVKRCRQMTDIKWTPAVDLPRYILAQTSNPPDTAEGQRYIGAFRAGEEYKGIPYGRTDNMTRYGYSYATVGSYIDFGTFISSVSNPKSQLSVRDIGSVANHASVIYASVCSGFACYALGVGEVPTASIPSISGMSLIGKVNDNGTLLGDNNFKIGDILNLQGSHVGIITDIIRDSEGVIQSVEISESTASGLADKTYADGKTGGVARRKGWTRWNLFYEKWKNYSLYRYSGTVTYIPSPYVNVGDEFDSYVVEHFPIMPYEGEGFAYKTGYIPNNAVKLVYTLSDYAYVKVFKDGTEISGSPFALTEGTDSINITEITAGDYTAYLCNISNGDVVNLTYPCHWSIE